MKNPRRQPEEESVDLYPGLVVHDGRQGGSITVGPSRLPVSTLIHSAILESWDKVEYGWSPSRYGWTAEMMADFLHSLLSVRGELERLLLVLANAERATEERRDAALEGHGPVVIVTPNDPQSVRLPRRGGRTRCCQRRFSSSFAGA